MQETWYELAYYAPGTSITIDEFGRGRPDSTFIASYQGETDAESLLFRHTFVDEGFFADISGRSISLHGIENSSYWGEFEYTGDVSFGVNNLPDEWSFRTRATTLAAGAWYLYSKSEGWELLGNNQFHEDFARIENPELVQGMTVYDVLYWEPDNSYYSTRPGRWSVSLSHVCYTTLNGEYQGDAACVTPVPLPLSGLALMSAIASLVAAGKGQARRSKPAATAL